MHSLVQKHIARLEILGLQTFLFPLLAPLQARYFHFANRSSGYIHYPFVSVLNLEGSISHIVLPGLSIAVQIVLIFETLQ